MAGSNIDAEKDAKVVESIQDLYTVYSLPIYRYLLSLCGCEQSAHDLTQETFYQALISIPRFRGEAKVSTWLYKLARNQYLNSVRSRRREDSLGKELSKLSPGIETRPEEILLRNHTKAEVRSVLSALPEVYRTVLLLKEVENLSHKEIGAILGKSAPSTKVLLFRAKQRFRDIYNKEVEI